MEYSSRLSCRYEFSALDIAGMLKEYEGDHKTGMDINAIAGMIFDYTSVIHFLKVVSKLCLLIDEIRSKEEPQFLNTHGQRKVY